MDILDMQEYFQAWFIFKATTPMNVNYEFLGIGDKNFILNSGSYFVFVLSAFGGSLASYLINYCAVKASRFKCARIIGMKVYNPQNLKDFILGNIKLFFEAYFDLTMCAFLSNFAFY